MIDNKHLLDDKAMQDFVINGYTVVKPDLPQEFHRTVCEQALAITKSGRGFNNTLVAEIPMLQTVLDDPAVHGALTSILGPNYVINQHNACHYHPPGSKEQHWHKDYPLGGNVRCHRPRLAMAFYYPQDVTAEMGPTAIQPTTQYCMTSQSDAPKLPLCGSAGTVTIVHYELWHRATANRSDKVRFMLKFLFCRTEEPTRASWNAEQPLWQAAPANGGIRHQAMWRHLWRWYSGGHNGNIASLSESAAPAASSAGELVRALQANDIAVRRTAADSLGFVGEDAASEIVPALAECLNDADEVVRLNAAYALGTLGEPAVPTLIDALYRESEAAWEVNVNRDDFTNPSQLDSPFGLAAAGEPALTALVAALDDAHWWVRAAAVAALGCMGLPAQPAVPALVEALQDESEWVRRNAADSLGNIGQPASRTAQPALVEALDDNRKVSRWSLSDSPFRENAVVALAKMGELSPLAIRALERALTDENEYIRSWAAVALGVPEE